MLTYIIFLILSSIVISILVLKLKLPKPQLIIPIIIFIIILPMAAGYFIENYFSSIPIVIVPNLKGLNLEEARNKLSEVKLLAEDTGSVYNPELLEGQVVSQRPAAGKKVKTGRIIKLLLSSGARKVVVPNLLGRPMEQAAVVLSAKGLALGKIEEDLASGINSGIILLQNPFPGEEVVAGTSIEVTISASPETRKTEGGFKFW